MWYVVCDANVTNVNDNRRIVLRHWNWTRVNREDFKFQRSIPRRKGSMYKYSNKFEISKLAKTTSSIHMHISQTQMNIRIVPYMEVQSYDAYIYKCWWWNWLSVVPWRAKLMCKGGWSPPIFKITDNRAYGVWSIVMELWAFQFFILENGSKWVRYVERHTRLQCLWAWSNFQ